MRTTHQIYYHNSNQMTTLPEQCIDLVVTSPPYPMIEMWDELFRGLNPKIGQALQAGQGRTAYELMHQELDKVWKDVFRVLKPSGMVCINIGDATRTIHQEFSLYTNHARITSQMQSLGFSSLPAIIWRKQTNAPNKFMGSGMFPPGAYVTLEHEYILVFRKGGKMAFQAEASKDNRRESGYFWEERNQWFSDVWMDLKGTPQTMKKSNARARSGAYPFELPYRLINMFSVKGATVLDPFLGMGTTTLAALASARNSIGFEINPELKDTITRALLSVAETANLRVHDRLENHLAFVRQRQNEAYPFKYTNIHYGFPVMTNQEKHLLLNDLVSVREIETNVYEADHTDEPQAAFSDTWEAAQRNDGKTPKGPRFKASNEEDQQGNLFGELAEKK